MDRIRGLSGINRKEAYKSATTPDLMKIIKDMTPKDIVRNKKVEELRQLSPQMSPSSNVVNVNLGVKCAPRNKAVTILTHTVSVQTEAPNNEETAVRSTRSVETQTDKVMPNCCRIM